MSQKVAITKVSHKGAAVYLGVVRNLETGASEDAWSSDPERIMRWLCDGWRSRFNQRRSVREKYGPNKTLIPIGGEVVDVADSVARKQFSWLACIPSPVLASTLKIEADEWWASVKRRKTLLAKGKDPGRMPKFKSVKDGLGFVCWRNQTKSGNAIYVRTGRKSGMVVISGQNSKPHVRPGDKAKWVIRIHIRTNQAIRPYTSVRVNWSDKTLVFVNSPLPLRKPVEKTEAPTTFVGLDRGVVHNLATSNGDFYDLPTEQLKKIDQRIRSHQKAMSRSFKAWAKTRPNKPSLRDYKQHGYSNRYRNHLDEVKRLKGLASRIVKHHQHCASADLVKNYDLIVCEKLSIAKMSAKKTPIPDPLKPGKYLPNGQAKQRGLNRVLAGAGLAQLKNMIDYKAALIGVGVVEVDAKNTSRYCRACGHVGKENRKSQAVFCCQKCGYRANADTNAANNILLRAFRDHGKQINKQLGWAIPDVERLQDSICNTVVKEQTSMKRKPSALNI